ncbi:MAG: hypothetical protein GY950_01900 [bacterium]|nr:hypothetical protein [bacterium]
MDIPIKKIDDLFERAEVGLANAKKDPYILKRISQYGFDDVRLGVGTALLKTARADVQRQLKLYAGQQTVTEKLRKKRLEAGGVYMSFVKMVRRSFKGDVQVIQLLGLKGLRFRTLGGLIEQGTQFYENAINNDEVFAKIQSVVGTKENLQAGWNLIKECAELNRKQENAKGKAQNATEQRDKNIRALRIYMANFTTACRAALKESPQLLEKLKIKAYSKGYKKNKKKTAEPTDSPAPNGST